MPGAVLAYQACSPDAHRRAVVSWEKTVQLWTGGPDKLASLRTGPDMCAGLNAAPHVALVQPFLEMQRGRDGGTGSRHERGHDVHITSSHVVSSTPRLNAIYRKSRRGLTLGIWR